MKQVLSAVTFFVTFLVALSGCRPNYTSDCASTNAQEPLRYLPSSFPYAINSQRQFLHNGADTQSFIVRSLESYFITQDNGPKCDVDYQCIKAQLINQTANDALSIDYTYDPSNYAGIPGLMNANYFYKIGYKDQLYDSHVYDSDTNKIIINNVKYDKVRFIGRDTTSRYVAWKYGTGILKIQTENEKWELIP